MGSNNSANNVDKCDKKVEKSCCDTLGNEKYCEKHSRKHEGECCSHSGCGCGGDGSLNGLQIFIYIVGGVLLALAFLGELGFVNKWLAICLSAVVYVFFGKEAWVGAYKDVKRKKIFTEFTLMCVASLGAVCLGEFADAAAVIYLYSLGEIISGTAYTRSRENIASLIEITEERVTVIKDKKAVSMPASEVCVGDTVSVRMGDKLSLDGIVVGGEGYADTSNVTGESAPVELVKGSDCLSGSLLVSGAVLVRVTERYENSTASKLKDAVERATREKAVREKKITRFAEFFTPFAFAVAVLVFVIALVMGGGVAKALRPALVVLVASCPCSLVLSVPLAYFSGIGRAANNGIVFRNGQTVENVANIGTVIFDKTGTLTSSKPTFVGVTMPKDSSVSKREMLDCAKAALLRSPHALARVFCEGYEEGVVYQPENVKNIGGRGLICLIGGVKAAFGNQKLMEGLNVKVPSVDKSSIYVAIDGKYCGALLFEAKTKENALTEISALRGNGVRRVAIMSGDNENAVKTVAIEVGVDEYYSGLKPDEKLKQMTYIYKEEKKSNPRAAVAFCGDGLNDSAVIARADVGIAMGSGSALTVDSADVVIVDDNLERLNDMLRSSRKTVGIVNQNIAISLAVKFAVVLIGLCGYPSLELAVLADVGAAVATVLNSMRAGRVKNRTANC